MRLGQLTKDVLTYLYTHKKVSSHDLISNLHKSRQSIHNCLTRLENNNLIRKTKTTNANLVELTPEGFNLAKSLTTDSPAREAETPAQVPVSTETPVAVHATAKNEPKVSPSANATEELPTEPPTQFSSVAPSTPVESDSTATPSSEEKSLPDLITNFPDRASVLHTASVTDPEVPDELRQHQSVPEISSSEASVTPSTNKALVSETTNDRFEDAIQCLVSRYRPAMRQLGYKSSRDAARDIRRLWYQHIEITS